MMWAGNWFAFARSTISFAIAVSGTITMVIPFRIFERALMQRPFPDPIGAKHITSHPTTTDFNKSYCQSIPSTPTRKLSTPASFNNSDLRSFWNFHSIFSFSRFNEACVFLRLDRNNTDRLPSDGVGVGVGSMFIQKWHNWLYCDTALHERPITIKNTSTLWWWVNTVYIGNITYECLVYHTH